MFLTAPQSEIKNNVLFFSKQPYVLLLRTIHTQIFLAVYMARMLIMNTKQCHGKLQTNLQSYLASSLH